MSRRRRPETSPLASHLETMAAETRSAVEAMVPVQMTDPLFTPREAARLLHVCPETFRRWIRKGVVGIVRIGPSRRIRIARSEIERQKRYEPGI